MFLKIFLFPLAVLYDGITRLRNYLFDIGHKPSFYFDIPVVSVGNLAVGGTGKTPMTEYLIRLLKKDFRLATLSRGYGRNTTGLRFASETESAATIGDEPFQMYIKFKEDINVTVCEDRAFAIPNILHQFPETDIILLDDAFQHRAVKPSLSILISEFSNPFYTDFVMPFGRLREARKGAKRADIVVISKCPADMNMEQMNHAERQVKHHAGDKPVLFSGIRYATPVSFGRPSTITKKVILVTGIANANVLKHYVASHYELVKHFVFRDHHYYTKNDLAAILECCKQQGDVSILTTEKDRVKLMDRQFDRVTSAMPWHYLPIEFYFLNEGAKFDNLILNKLSATERNL